MIKPNKIVNTLLTIHIISKTQHTIILYDKPQKKLIHFFKNTSIAHSPNEQQLQTCPPRKNSVK